MTDKAILNDLSVKQKRCSYFLICFISLLGGVEYAVILPTLYLHLDNTWHAKSYYLGLVISAYSFSGLFAAPMMGRFYDKTRKSKFLISLTNVFEIAGSLMYWIGLSPLFLMFSRLVAGLGNGFFPVVLAEVSHDTSNKARTSVVSAIMATRQFGLLLGPAFNLFLSRTNFYIGPFIVDKYSSPGIFMAILWLIAQILTMVLYRPLTQMVSVTSPPSTTAHSVSSSPDSHNDTMASSVNQTVAQTTQNGAVPSSNGYAVNGDVAQKPLTINGSDLGESTVVPVEENAEATPTWSLRKVLLDITYDEYMAIYMLTFISLFNQCGLETMVTPICNDYLGWTELQLSLMYCVAGVVVLVGYFMVHIGSKKFKDRTLIVFGLLCQLVSYSWNIYWLPRFRANEPEDYLHNLIILIPALVVNVFGLPFLFVCHISLFSKLMSKEIQGVGHGIRRVIGGLASILGPLWAGALLADLYLMLGVMIGLNALAMLLLMLSFDRLQAPSTTPQNEDISSPVKEEANEQTPLLS